jgi:broad specificity phosphatase PhoE
MTRVWLIRHAASTAPAGLAIGVSDPPLSELGRRQARSLATHLATRRLGRVISSDLRRALETASSIAAPHRLEVEATPYLREIDFGSWEGRHLGDLWSEDPAAARAWEDDVLQTPPGFGESAIDVENRIARFWEVLSPAAGAGEVAIVGHGGSLAALRALITGEPMAATLAAGLAIGSMVALDTG